MTVEQSVDLARTSPTRMVIEAVAEETWLADFEVADRLVEDGLDRAQVEFAIKVLRDVGVLAKGGPVEVQRSTVRDDMLDRLDRLVLIGAGSRLP